MFNGIQVCFLFFQGVFKSIVQINRYSHKNYASSYKNSKAVQGTHCRKRWNPSWLLRQINTVSRPAPARHTLSLTHAAASQAKSTRTSNRSQGYPNESHVATWSQTPLSIAVLGKYEGKPESETRKRERGVILAR